MTKQTSSGKGVYDVFNFGTGKGSSVFELISALEKAAGKKVNYFVGPRRDGDLLQSYCDPTKAATVLGWKAAFGLDKICEDAWRWQSNNPEGFEGK
jgi:UDP-glucose 4-epimerase